MITRDKENTYYYYRKSTVRSQRRRFNIVDDMIAQLLFVQLYQFDCYQ